MHADFTDTIPIDRCKVPCAPLHLCTYLLSIHPSFLVLSPQFLVLKAYSGFNVSWLEPKSEYWLCIKNYSLCLFTQEYFFPHLSRFNIGMFSPKWRDDHTATFFTFSLTFKLCLFFLFNFSLQKTSRFPVCESKGIILLFLRVGINISAYSWDNKKRVCSSIG